MEKFKGKYRIPSARLQTWNYGWNGAYFITICTKNRVNRPLARIKNIGLERSHKQRVYPHVLVRM